MQCPNCQANIKDTAKFCSECGAKIPRKVEGGLNLGDVGMIRDSTFISGLVGAENNTPNGDYCDICGEWVRVEDSFRCRECGRTGLCKTHRDTVLNVCEECVVKMRPVEEPKLRSQPEAKPESGIVREVGDRIVISLAKGAEMEFVRVPAGVFWMGSGDDDPVAFSDQKPQHQVHLETY